MLHSLDKLCHNKTHFWHVWSLLKYISNFSQALHSKPALHLKETRHQYFLCYEHKQQKLSFTKILYTLIHGYKIIIFLNELPTVSCRMRAWLWKCKQMLLTNTTLTFEFLKLGFSIMPNLLLLNVESPAKTFCMKNGVRIKLVETNYGQKKVYL